MVCPDALRRTIRRIGWRYKKSLVATERDDERRAVWLRDTQRMDARQMVIIDETSTTISLVR